MVGQRSLRQLCPCSLDEKGDAAQFAGEAHLSDDLRGCDAESCRNFGARYAFDCHLPEIRGK